MSGTSSAVITVTIALLCAASLVIAADAPKDFTFRRVKPPAAGVAKRITIQVQPEKTSDSATAPAAEAANAAFATDAQAWFWNEISPDLDQSGPGRFAAAVDQMQNAPADGSVRADRLQDMRAVAGLYGTDILLATLGKKISPAFVLAMIGAESGGKSDALSAKGAQGLMQLMPDTAARFGVDDASDPAQNIRGGVAYLDWLLEKFDRDPILALAGYNAGENAVIASGGVPAFPETRAYVPRIIANWQVARALCITPPELFSDGCVFAVERTP